MTVIRSCTTLFLVACTAWCCRAQPTLSAISVVEFADEPGHGTVVASSGGTVHFVRVITRQQDADAPLLEEANVVFPKGTVAKATLLRRISVDDRYILGLYACTNTTSYAEAHRMNAARPATGDRLFVVNDRLPPDEAGFEPYTRGSMVYESPYQDHYFLRADPASRWHSSSPVYAADGGMLGITTEGASRDKLDLIVIPITRVRELIMGDQGSATSANGRRCEQFDLRDQATGRNSCEQLEYLEKQRKQAADHELEQQRLAHERYSMQTKEVQRYGMLKEKNPFAWAPFIAWARNTDFSLVPAGFDLFVIPDRFVHIHAKVQGGLVIGHREYEEEVAQNLGFNRIRSSSWFGEGLIGFGLGKNGVFGGVLGGYGMEGPVKLTRFTGDSEITITSSETWYRPVTQVEIGYAYGHVRLLLAFRSALGDLPPIYKAENLGLPFMGYRPTEDMAANKTLILFELAYRIRGWWSKEMKEEAEVKYRQLGGLPKP